MNIPSPSCVRGIEFLQCVDDSMVQSPSPFANESDDSDSNSPHHLLVGRWFRERFFLPEQYKSASLYEPDDESDNDIIDDAPHPPDRPFALFSDNLVSREIQYIDSASDGESDDESYDEDSCSLPYRCTHPTGNSRTRACAPSGLTRMLDGAPMFPLDRCHEGEPDERFEAEADSGDGNKDCCSQRFLSMKSIQRTFSFDDELPVALCKGKNASGIRSVDTTPCTSIDEDDSYCDEQPSFEILVTYPKEENRSRVLYPVSMPSYVY